MTTEAAETKGNAPKGIKCLGYAGRKYYLLGELDDDLHSYTAAELLNRSTLCELRAVGDWKTGAPEGNVDWPTEGSHLIAACKKAGKFETKEEKKAEPKAKLNGAILDQHAQPFDGWLEQLQRTDRGIKGNDYNVTVALRLCPQLAGKIGWDVRQMAFVSVMDSPAGLAGPWTDSHTARLAVWLQGHDIPVTTRHVDTALAAAGKSNRFDPLRDYLDGLEWDGQERIGTWLADYCQADRSDANSIMGSKWLIGAAARALRPGCRMDYMLVLEGDQGTRKSTLIKTLGGDYAGENLPDFHSRDAMQIAASSWIIEVAELAAIRRSEMDAIKAFITRVEDTYVPKYGKYPIKVKRWSVLVGNVNPEGFGYLQDTTGNRRFWPVKVGQLDIEAVAKDRDQLWAEAVFCLNRGDAWWPTAEEQTPLSEQQAGRLDSDDWLPAIEKWLSYDQETGAPVEQTTTAAVGVGALSIPLERLSRFTQMRIAKCLIELGFKNTKTGPANKRIRAFVRKPPVVA